MAGPAANLGLFLLAAVGIRAGLASGAFLAPASVSWFAVTEAASPGWATGAAMLLSVFFTLNLLLFALNLIPVPPLDGSAAIQLFMRPETAARYQALLAQPAVGWIGIILVWSFFGEFFRPLFLGSLRLLYPTLTYG